MSNLQIALERSKEIVDKADKDYFPHSIVSMISGGKDSVCAYLVAKELGVNVSHIMHGVTGTGVKETTDFVRSFAASESPIYLEADAGTTYVDYVTRKGFFGKGIKAHSFTYHLLKSRIFRTTISTNIRKRRRFIKILLLNGSRFRESINRTYNLYHPVNEDGSNIWVNIINHWTTEERDEYLERVNAPCNPVTKLLCRSGECLCGTMQNQATREEVSFYFPEWGKWLDELDTAAKMKFGFGWGDDVPLNSKGTYSSFQPMCVDCLDEGEK